MSKFAVSSDVILKSNLSFMIFSSIIELLEKLFILLKYNFGSPIDGGGLKFMFSI